ncbi:hypothetical protein [Neobacillus drentensis]|nr:hypothetical protein [Neobacillus drentensis]
MAPTTLIAVLHSYGHTKETMVVTVIMNVISIFGSFIAIKGWFGLPVTGVAGVAYAMFAARIFIIADFFTLFINN